MRKAKYVPLTIAMTKSNKFIKEALGAEESIQVLLNKLRYNYNSKNIEDMKRFNHIENRVHQLKKKSSKNWTCIAINMLEEEYNQYSAAVLDKEIKMIESKLYLQ